MDINDVGELADKADNLVQMSQNKIIPDCVHVENLRECLKDVSNNIKEYYSEQTGYNPWE